MTGTAAWWHGRRAIGGSPGQCAGVVAGSEFDYVFGVGAGAVTPTPFD